MAAVHPVKTYIGLAKIGITSDTPISTADVCAQMPVSTELFDGTSSASTPQITDIPFMNSTLHIVKLSNLRCYCVCIDRDNNGVAVATWTTSKTPNFSGWKEIATATPPQEYDLPLAEGVTAAPAAIYYKTQDNIVHIEMMVSGEFSGDTILAVLPVGYRPKRVIRCTPSCWLSPQLSGTGFITPDGNIGIGFPSTVGRCSFNATFEAAE